MGDTAMPLNPVLWSKPLSVDRGQLDTTVDADEEEDLTRKENTFEILEPNHSFLYSTIIARNLQVSKTTFLNLSLPTTTEEEEEEEIVVHLDGEAKEPCDEEKPAPKRTTPCKRISYKIKRSSSAYRKLNNRNPIRGSTVAELASKFDKLCLEKKYILDDPKFAQIIKRVNSQNYTQGDAGKINRKTNIKMNGDEKNSRKPFSKQNNESAEDKQHSIVKDAIKKFECQQNDTKTLQLSKHKIPEKKSFWRSMEVLPTWSASSVGIIDDNHVEQTRNKGDFEMPVVNIPVERTIRCESTYEMSKVKQKISKLEFKVDPRIKPEVIVTIVPLSPRSSEEGEEEEENSYDAVAAPAVKPAQKKVQPPVPPKPTKSSDSKKNTKNKASKTAAQDMTYDEVSMGGIVHSYEDIEHKTDDGYETIIPLNYTEQNIYETLIGIYDRPPPLPKRQEELLPPKLPSKNSYYKVHGPDDSNNYEIIDTGGTFRTSGVSEGSDSSYDAMMELKLNSSSLNRGSLISCDQQSNSLYGRSISGFDEDKVSDNSFSDGSENWCDYDDDEQLNHSESTQVHKRKNSREQHQRLLVARSRAESHHYESVTDHSPEYHTPDSFDNEYDISEPLDSTYSGVDVTNTRLPDTPNNGNKVIRKVKRFLSTDLSKSLRSITKRKSRTDLDNVNNFVDGDKTRNPSKSYQRNDSNDSSSTPTNTVESDQTYVDASTYEKQKRKSRAKSTFYVSEVIDMGTAEKDCDMKINQKSKTAKSSPVRPCIPPPPLPKQTSANDSLPVENNYRKPPSWNAQSGVDDSTVRTSTASWYAEVDLYRDEHTSTPSTSSAENSGSGTSNRNELDAINYHDTETCHNLRNETEYNKSISSDNEPEMDNTSSALSGNFLQEEPLYQFYNKAIVDSICHEGTEWDSDSYEEVSTSDSSETRSRPSAMELTKTRTFWCQIPEVKHSDIFNTLTLEERKLQEAKFEMMTSEASYLKSLNLLTKYFIQPLYKCRTASREDLDILFGKIPTVKNCSEKLLHDLERCWQDNILLPDICRIVYEHAEENFSVYVSYCENQILLDSTLKKLIDGLEFRTTLEKLEKSTECAGLTLYSFLMLPMQRVTRWPLLLDAVLRRLSSGDTDYLPCQCALTTINKIAKQCNEAAREKEREAEMKKVVGQISFGFHKPPFDLMSKGRWLVKSGSVTQIIGRRDDGRLTFGKKFVKKSLYLFLFNDMFIVSKHQQSENNYAVIHYCPRLMIEVSDDNIAPNPPVRDTANRNFIFLTILEDQHDKLVELLLSCDSSTDKARWLNVLAPARSDDPNETVYERWDCPQVTAIYDYNINQPDELNITKGDAIHVTKKMSDGWYFGERLRDQQSGWFPQNFVVEIVNPHVRARNLKQRYRLLNFSQSYYNANI